MVLELYCRKAGRKGEGKREREEMLERKRGLETERRGEERRGEEKRREEKRREEKRREDYNCHSPFIHPITHIQMPCGYRELHCAVYLQNMSDSAGSVLFSPAIKFRGLHRITEQMLYSE
jgi:hypothetical protein